MICLLLLPVASAMILPPPWRKIVYSLRYKGCSAGDESRDGKYKVELYGLNSD